jgi:hypothetical protein
MTTALQEFTINLPMVGVSPVGHPAVEMPYIGAPCDVTADICKPEDISPCCSHISAYVDKASVCVGNPDDTLLFVDLVMDVCITDPNTKAVSTYKMVKRVAMDKVKLACQAENIVPHQVVEAITPEQEAKKLVEQQAAERAQMAARRARQLAGLGE